MEVKKKLKRIFKRKKKNNKQKISKKDEEIIKERLRALGYLE